MERYVSFAYYQEEYHGTVIKSEAAWNGVVLSAQAFVDRITFSAAEPSIPGVKEAVCAAAEALAAANRSGGVSSENNDGYSVTFQRVSNTQGYAAAYRAARLFLPPELLYRGVDL